MYYKIQSKAGQTKYTLVKKSFKIQKGQIIDFYFKENGKNETKIYTFYFT